MKPDPLHRSTVKSFFLDGFNTELKKSFIASHELTPDNIEWKTIQDWLYGTDFYVTKKFHNTKKWNDFVRYKLRWKLRLATAEELKIRKDKENKDKQELELLQMAYERAKSNKKRFQYMSK